jgi:hypothetical protein
MSGKASETEISLSARRIATLNGFVIKSCKFEGSSDGRLVKIAAVQTKFPHDGINFAENQGKQFTKIEEMIKVATEEGVKIIALPELFCE